MHFCGLRPRKDLNLKVSSSPHHQNKYNGSSKQPYFAIALNVKVYKLFCENKVADILNDPCHSLIETVPAATIFRKHNFQFGGHGAKLPATMQTPRKETKKYTAIMCSTSPSGYLFKPPAFLSWTTKRPASDVQLAMTRSDRFHPRYQNKNRNQTSY